uniref:Uncharacterized protein n=1 Tax=Panagrolaimus sp. ES5 TaxID=591445 RepID=A0AC34G7N4_9BILA
MNQKDYREISAVPSSKPYVSHMQYENSRGQSVTLFPAFRSVDTLHDISRIQSPIKLNTVPLITRNQDKWANKYHEIVREYGPSKDDPKSLLLFGKDELYRSESSGNPTLKPSTLHVSTESSPPAPVNSNPPPALPPPPPVPPRETSTKYPFTRQPSIRRQTYPRMRYIYAFPEEFRNWIAQPTFSRFPPPSAPEEEYHPSENTTSVKKSRPSIHRPIPVPRRSFESKIKPSQYENIPSTQKSIVEEIKEKIKNKKSSAASLSAASSAKTTMVPILKRKKEL